MNRRVFAALLAILLVSAPALHSVPADPPVYQIEDLGRTADGLVPTVTGINASGQVSGYVYRSGSPRAVRFTNGFGWENVSGLESVYGLAMAINASGDLTGYYRPAANLRAFRYADGVGVTPIDLLPGGTFSYGMAIAANGDVIGYGNSTSGQRAWRASPGLLPIVPAALTSSISSACGVNGAGQIVGAFRTSAGLDHAFRLEPDGSLTDVGTLGGLTSSGCALDADGRVGGQSKVGTATHAFVFTGTALIDVDAFNSSTSRILAMSNGVAVGNFASPGTAGKPHALLYTDAGGAVDLNSRIPADSGWVLSDAVAVSPNGQIVGHGLLGGTARVFRLTPGPAPDTTAPVITSLSVTPSSVTPPNKAMVAVTVAAAATDDRDPSPVCTASVDGHGAPAADFAMSGPLAGSVRATGGATYSFTVTCRDAAGNAATRAVDVVVPPDTTPPVVTSLTATPSRVWPPNDALVPVTVAVSATDDSAEAPACALSAITSSGSTADDHSITGQYSARVRAVGGRTYSLRVTCTDAALNRREASVDVVVPPDTTAPEITALSASPNHIWPPNGKMESVTLSVTATDDVDAAPKCALTSIAGAPAANAVVTGPFTASVRAEKDAVYTFTVGCADKAGNTSQGSVRVTVSKDPPLAVSSASKK